MKIGNNDQEKNMKYEIESKKQIIGTIKMEIDNS